MLIVVDLAITKVAGGHLNVIASPACERRFTARHREQMSLIIVKNSEQL